MVGGAILSDGLFFRFLFIFFSFLLSDSKPPQQVVCGEVLAFEKAAFIDFSPSQMETKAPTVSG